MARILRFILLLLLFGPLPGISLINASAQGKLFLIGGGSRPQEMINTLVSMAGLFQGGYGVVLPMTGEGDTACAAAVRQFPLNRGVKMRCLFFAAADVTNPVKLDSLRQARLIYIPEGDPERFMGLIRGTPVATAISEAFRAGAVVAGTDAGAAVTGKWMITGKERKHAVPTGEFKTLESGNIELKEGLGLVEKLVFDTRFLQRYRMNRLLSVVIEQPGLTGVGIDEATAVVIEGGTATVLGDSQVFFLSAPAKARREVKGRLAAQGIQLSIYVSGDQVQF